GYLPLRADALFLQGTFEVRLSLLADAEPTLHEAISVAESAGDDELAARSWTTLVGVNAEKAHFAEAHRCAQHADGVLSRLGDRPELKARWYLVTSLLARMEGRNEDSLDLAREGLELREKALGPDHLDVAQSLANIGRNLHLMARYEEAL